MKTFRHVENQDRNRRIWLPQIPSSASCTELFFLPRASPSTMNRKLLISSKADAEGQGQSREVEKMGSPMLGGPDREAPTGPSPF